MDSRDIITEIINAHGGQALWNNLNALEAEISVWGMLFTVKRIATLNHARVTAWAHEPRFVFHDFPSPGLTGELIGNHEVRILNKNGAVTEKRINPRSAFKGLRRIIYWANLDFIYFGGYATWNYLITPFLFLREGFHFEVLDPTVGSYPSWAKLKVTFPEGISHSFRK